MARFRKAALLSTVAVLVLAMTCVVAAWLRQQDADARELLGRGHYGAGLTAVEKLAAVDVEAREAWARALLETGQYSRAEEVSAAATTPRLGRYRVEALVCQGKYDAALSLVDTLLERNRSWPGLHYWRGALLDRRGRRDDALAAFRTALAMAAAQKELSSESQAMAGLAAQRLEQFHEANDLLRQANELSKESEYRVFWGDLFESKFNAGEAKNLYSEVLEINPKHPLALLGMARATEIESAEKSSELARKALETNPALAEARLHLASLALQEDDFEKAEQLLKAVRQDNPGLLEAHALSAANFHFWDKPVEKERHAKAIAAIHPGYADLELLLGELSATKRRIEDAAEHFRHAIELEPGLWDAWAGLGMSLLRMGEDQSGKEALERAYRGDPFNVWTVNTLRLVDSFKNFDQFETTHFKVKLHQKESAVIRPHLEPLLEKAYQRFSSMFQYQPNYKITIEVYPDHEDFAVRTLGLPGLGALGATFGRVVAMDSPSAKRRGVYNWASTLWHEMAHVFTLGMTDQRVPRWLTEGISMVEERRGGTGWGEGVDARFLKALRENKLLPVEELNSGFVRPRYEGQLQVSYLQAAFLTEYIEEKYGFEKVRQMLAAYRTGSKDRQVFETVLRLEAKKLDAEFTRYLKERWGTHMVLAEGPWEQEQSLAEWKSALARNPSSYWIRLRVAAELEKSGALDEAVEYLEQARQIAPTYGHPGGPHRRLAEIYNQKGNRQRATDLMKEYVALQDEDVDAWLKLADWQADFGQNESALESYKMSLYIDPFAPSVYRSMAELATRLKKPAEAIAACESALALEKVDRAGAHYDLAVAYLAANRREDARRQVLAALEIAPGFERAQELLLKIVRP